MKVSQIILQQLREDLTPCFTRPVICKKLGGLISPGGLANLDSEGLGPPRVRAGRSVLYEKNSFLEWLERRFSDEELDNE